MNDFAIKVNGVGKKFSKSLKHVMLYGLSDVSKNVFGMKAKTDVLRSGEFWAVDGVSFELKKGETYGIIGPNGSGKTTMLKMLNGIFMPDKGTIGISGRVGALIQVGAGFHPLLTGRENIYVNGAILGMSTKEIDEKFDSIVEFSEIGDFLDAPVRHYSSGMYVKLGFSIAVYCEPDVLLVDEVLAVGDARFYKKCTNKIDELKRNNTTIVLVSHNMWLIKTMCDRVMVLDKGAPIKEGDPAECIYEYSQVGMTPVSGKTSPTTDTSPVILTSVVVNNSGGDIVEEIDPDEALDINVKYSCRQNGAKGVFFLRVTTPDAYPLYTSYTNDIEFAEGEGSLQAKLPSFGLLEGEYKLWIGVADNNKEDSVFQSEPTKVVVRTSDKHPDPRYGMFINNVNWQI